MIYILLFVLTLADVFLTTYGLATSRISEGNPLMAKLLDFNLILGALAILALAAGFIWFISKQKFKWQKPACYGLLIIKIGIMAMHTNWLIK